MQRPSSSTSAAPPDPRELRRENWQGLSYSPAFMFQCGSHMTRGTNHLHANACPSLTRVRDARTRRGVNFVNFGRRPPASGRIRRSRPPFEKGGPATRSAGPQVLMGKARVACREHEPRPHLKRHRGGDEITNRSELAHVGLGRRRSRHVRLAIRRRGHAPPQQQFPEAVHRREFVVPLPRLRAGRQLGRNLLLDRAVVVIFRIVPGAIGRHVTPPPARIAPCRPTAPRRASSTPTRTGFRRPGRP